MVAKMVDGYSSADLTMLSRVLKEALEASINGAGFTEAGIQELGSCLGKAIMDSFVAGETDPEVLKSYAGTYSGDGFEVKFDIVDGKLTGGPVGQKPESYDAVDSTTFRHPVMTMLKLTFNLEAGKVSSLTLKRGDNKPTVLKKAATTK